LGCKFIYSSLLLKGIRCSCCSYRLWYKRGLSGKEKTAYQLHYLHVIPARLETHPRAFNPKFQTLDATLDLLNEQLAGGESLIDGWSTYFLYDQCIFDMLNLILLYCSYLVLKCMVCVALHIMNHVLSALPYSSTDSLNVCVRST